MLVTGAASGIGKEAVQRLINMFCITVWPSPL